MTPRTVLSLITFSLLTCSLLYCQSKKLPAFPEVSADDRWARAQNHADVFYVAGIGYAKSIGRTPNDFFRYCVKTFAPSWGKPDSVKPIQFLRGMQRSLLAFSDWKFELIDYREDRVTGRFSRPYVSRLFATNASFYGVTLDEYEAGLRTFHRGLCDYLHLKYEDKVERDWITFTISKK
ncbi:MAG: hypothetical protein FJ215_08070 [Ignavibacteria bacterium]|nr:hypothetical protein [Ignavibacteria bacterium]